MAEMRGMREFRIRFAFSSPLTQAELADRLEELIPSFATVVEADAGEILTTVEDVQWEDKPNGHS